MLTGMTSLTSIVKRKTRAATLVLSGLKNDSSTSCLGRAFDRRRQHHVGGGDRRHLDDEVDAVEERPREAGLVLRHAALVRLPAAGEARLGRLAAAARVHGGDELENAPDRSPGGWRGRSSPRRSRAAGAASRAPAG